MTTPHERDRSLEQWLRAGVPQSDALTEACLDAETVAAWLDGGLNASALQAAEAHVSTCARCQALTSSVVTLQTAAAAAEVPAPSTWRAWMNWIVPLGATAAAGLALVVWLKAPTPPVERAGEALQARVEQAPAPPAPAPSSSTPPASVPAEPTAGPAPASQREALSSSETASKAVSVPPATTGASTERATSADSAAANAAAGPSPEVTAREAAAPRARTAADAAAPVSAQQDAVANQAFAAREASGFDVLSPDAQVRWRLSGRAVLRSTDGGATWAPVPAETRERLLAGTAPSATVCWLVGEGGAVLRAVDGITFERTAPPVGSDLMSVTATGAGSAVVGTADGRHFATTDGGATWKPAR